jgi:hypothetical protein
VSAEDIQAFQVRSPFQPFRIDLTDGAAYEVYRPEMVLPERRTVVIGITADPAQTIADRVVWVSILHVVRLEPINTPAPSQT